LFEEIVLSSADIGLPDVHGHMQSERVYTHPGLRLSMDWRTGEWSPEYEDVARRLRDRGLVDGLLKKHGHLFDSDFAVKQFLCRLALQVRVALENEAILLGGQTFREFYDASISVIGKCFGMSTSDADGLLLTFKSKDLDILGLDFSPSDLDGFVEIRAESTIRAYGTEWREAIAAASGSENMREALQDAMEKAMDQEAVARRAKGAFETVGSFGNFASLIPVVGSAASAAGIAADAGARVAEAAGDAYHWYAIGSKMSEISVQAALRRRRNANQKGAHEPGVHGPVEDT